MTAPAPQQAQAPAPAGPTPQEEVAATMEKLEEKFRKALPKSMPTERFIRCVQTLVMTNEGLLAGDRSSLYNSALEAAQDGLYLDGKEAALVVFNVNVGTKEAARWIKKVKYMPMVQGILKKVRNSGELSTLASQVVHQNDKFRFWVDDLGEHVVHEPLSFGTRGEAIGVYALARTKDGANYVEIMDKAQVEAVKSKSRAQSSLMWTTFESEGWRKSAIRRLSKRLPMSSDLEVVIKRDDELFDLEPGAEETQPKPAQSSRLGKIIAAKPAPAPAVAAPAPARPPEEAPPLDDDDQVPV